MALNVRSDSWQNLLAGLGSPRDKAVYTQFQSSHEALSPEILDSLFVEDDIAARVCELPPNEILRQGFSVTIAKDNQAKAAINEAVCEFAFSQKLMDALVWARVFGGSALFVGVDDGQHPEKPVSLVDIRSVHFVSVLTSNDLEPVSFYNDPLKANFGEPKTYRIETSNTRLGSLSEIHESRLIVFHGTRTPKRMLSRNRGWSLSVLQRIYGVMQQFHLSWQATAHLMSDAAQAVFRLKGLHSAIAANKTEDLLKRMELVDMSRSVSRAVLLDADDEDFRRDSYSFAGIPQILEKFMLRLAAAARMPVSLLMGQSPAGMNATGDSDIRFFYDQIKAAQEELKPQISRFVQLLIHAKDGPTKGKELPFTVEFPSLWQTTAKEQAEIARIQSETDCRYIQEGVLLPQEVAKRRFGDEVFAAKSTLD